MQQPRAGFGARLSAILQEKVTYTLDSRARSETTSQNLFPSPVQSIINAKMEILVNMFG